MSGVIVNRFAEGKTDSNYIALTVCSSLRRIAPYQTMFALFLFIHFLIIELLSGTKPTPPANPLNLKTQH